jgi:hypothetical protein
VKGQPAGVAAHHLDHHHAVVAHGGGVDLIETFRGRVYGGIEAEGSFTASQIIVDGLGHANAVDAVFDQVRGAGHGAVAADAHDGVELVGAHVIDYAVGDVDPFGLAVAFDGKALGVGLVAGAEDGPAQGQDVRDVIPLQLAHAVLDQAQEAIFDAQHLQLVLVHGRLGHGSNHGVQPWAVAASGEHSDAFDVGHGEAMLAPILPCRPAIRWTRDWLHVFHGLHDLCLEARAKLDERGLLCSGHDDDGLSFWAQPAAFDIVW